MVQVLRMPSEAELPRGPRRDFTDQLFSLYKEAHRPGLRAISSAIPMNATATASVETIRRILRGISVPVRWDTVNVVLAALCELAGVDPDIDIGGRYDDDPVTRRQLVEQAWHEALDNPGGKKQARPVDDPWASDARGGTTYSDEPPF
jgi:hypothetical protein